VPPDPYRVRRNESPALAGEIVTDDDLDRIIGGKSIRTIRRPGGPARRGKLRKPRRHL
jgi:hypothetical protein